MMTKEEEINHLMALKGCKRGDTYFNQFFSSDDIEQMVRNIHADFAIEMGCSFAKKAEELEEFLKDDDNLKSAFKYEFANHECGYTYTPQDALPPLNLTYEEVEKNERLNRVFNEAWCEYLDECE